MSGHSKWSTIKRQKEATDIARGKLFSKLTRAISVAAKDGGSDPGANSKLRFAIEQARQANMPKANIERAVLRASEEGNLQEVTYEGFGPYGVGVMVEVLTDNRNRTGQEIKNIFERGGGSLGGPGSVSFNFQKRGLIAVKKENQAEDQMLKLIDLGIEEEEEEEDAIEIYTEPNQTQAVRKRIEGEGFSVLSTELVQKPKNLVTISDPDKVSKILSFLEQLEEHDDVHKVFANPEVIKEN